jgi:hypothetical protein
LPGFSPGHVLLAAKTKFLRGSSGYHSFGPQRQAKTGCSRSLTRVWRPASTS